MHLDTSQLLLALVISIILTLLLGIVMLLLQRATKDRSNSEYNELKQRAQLSDMRESFERQLEIINSQLLSSEQRWKEVNHLLLSAQQNTTFAPSITRKSEVVKEFPKFLLEMGISPELNPVDDDLVFVLTPFDRDFEEDFDAVKRTCDSVGLKCIRGDETHARGDILVHVLTMMIRARFVIANITSRNANVYYELGIAQALGKSAILISRDLKKLPFDLQSQRVLLYQNPDDLKSKLSEMLLRTVLIAHR
jgi:hypothetical protein